MEFLVTMTTRVPDGTTEQAVGEIRGREADRSRALAAEGRLLRLWRPPLLPGEWRTLGLFAAADEGELERTLASMPLRVWRSDLVVPLGPHPNDPLGSAANGSREFFTTFTVVVPEEVDADEVDRAERSEAERTRELAEEGHLVRLWMLPPEPGSWRALGLWAADDAAQLRSIVLALPLATWMTTEITPLSEHPNDPGIAGA
jgi:muconolactone delta-isomerase